MTGLKVHKIEIFFGFDFENCNISLIKIFDGASIGGGTIFPRSPKTTRNENFF